jgi:lipid-binding SYLF domain-containing protein
MKSRFRNPSEGKVMTSVSSKIPRLLALCLLVGLSLGALPAVAQQRPALDQDVHAAIQLLLNTSPAAKRLAPAARGALVFPNIVKAGFLVGVQYGNGALVRRKKGGGYYIANYYNITSASYGLQAGVQSFGYVMALMTDAAVEHVESSGGWELGVGPSIVIVDEGVARTLTTETAKSDVYAFTFGQRGMMAGLGLQGSKITRLNR